MSTATLLIELGTEELPPKSLRNLSDAFTGELLAGLLEAQLIDQSQADSANAIATPRRLGLLISDVRAAQADQQVERRGPAVAAAFKDDGSPTPAAQGFAKSCGVEVSDLERLKTDKGEWLSYNIKQAGKSIDDLITAIIEQAVKRLPIPKRMRWGDGAAEFVRPVKWLNVMHGARLIDCEILQVQASAISRGHRFHSDGEFSIDSADSYAALLRDQGHVIGDFAERQAMISEQIEALAADEGATLESDQGLLDEVTGLVEWPQALLGSFDEAFLEVPAECLISAMKDHQKYFHLRDKHGKLLARFITVSNIASSDPARVVAGNERVLRARLADARFFWETDQKQKLADRLPQLDNILFHQKLGSVGDKVRRLQTLAASIGETIGADAAITERSAMLAKADLVTNMVGEFDSLQGLMGHYYADLDGEDPRVGQAIEQHYWPRFAGDNLPASAEAQAVALADKLDSLVGLFGAGEIPTGDKDPYGLRRAALSILRILIEQQRTLTLPELVALSADAHAANTELNLDNTVREQIVGFVRGRLTAYYQAQGVATSAINAVMVCAPASPLDFDQRLNAVKQFGELEEATDLAAANKRISNILKKQSGSPSTDIDPALLVESAEQALFQSLEQISSDSTALFDAGDYGAGLQQLAALRTPVDDFFESVMVMSDDAAQQQNRLALLTRIQALFLRVADISQLST